MFDRPDGSAEPGDDDRRRPAAAPVTVRLAPAGRGTGVLAGLIAVFLAIALVKPWGDGDGARGPRPTPRVTAAPTVAPTADPLAALRRNCQDPPGWRVYSRERWASTTVRSWRTLEPVFGASGPLDPSVPILPLVGEIDALGYCSPWTAGERPPADAGIDGWRIALASGGDPRSGAEPRAESIPLQPFDPTWPSLLGALYGPPVDRFDPHLGDSVGWPAGRYVFAIRAPGYERWWGVDVEPPTASERLGGPAASAMPATP